ncbi:transposon Ty3-I Gag-Pol polyprotein [Nephila pilipes]|uniref:Transposon Ty3-I Gag-Pol polyprotein n=1 Tax=Nephila pilipes TaxID=299642 RepID=A0A8X6ULV7_NEPPI|nr:transposon Ty3-I Gag-Pol polyprotein [Nephila pilipes]
MLNKTGEISDRILEVTPVPMKIHAKNSNFLEENLLGPPIVEKPRILAPEGLKVVKAEFQNMIQLGQLRPSGSNYTYPLLMVPKKGILEWRRIGDLSTLNVQTVKENALFLA